MKYTQPYDKPSEPDAPYIDGNPAAGIEGSIVPAAAIEDDQREIVYVIASAGLIPNENDLTQLWQALQRLRGVRYGVDTGPVNALAVTFTPSILAYAAGDHYLVKVANSNTAAATLNINGLGARVMKRQDGTDLQPDDIRAGEVIWVVYDGTFFQLEDLNPYALQSGSTNYAVGTGPADAISVTLAPAITAYRAGLVVRFVVPATNVGNTTLNVNGLGPKQIVRHSGIILYDGDLVAGSVAECVYDGTKFYLVGASGPAVLRRNTTIFVNGAIGNDANDGSANDAAHAMATVQAACNRAYSYGPGPYTITIKIADGSYGNFATPLWAGPNIIVEGNVANRGAVVINGSGGNHAFMVQGPNTVTAQYITVASTGASGNAGFIAGGGAFLTTRFTKSNTVVGAVFEAYGSGSTINNVDSHQFAGNSAFLWWAIFGGNPALGPGCAFEFLAPITVQTGALANNGVITVSPTDPTFSNPGNVTGKKYDAQANGVIDAQGITFPGTIAGSTATGGQYIP